MSARRTYKVIFMNQGEVFEIYAKNVTQGGLFGFVEVEQLLFGERTQLVVDPSEEQLKSEFKGVKRVYIPLHSVIRIDEVEKEGPGRIKKAAAADGTLTPFPGPVYQDPRNKPVKP